MSGWQKTWALNQIAAKGFNLKAIRIARGLCSSQDDIDHALLLFDSSRVKRSEKNTVKIRHHYKDRIHELKTLGFQNYRDYINSDLWKEIRQKCLLRDDGRCRLCHFFKADHVHHQEYSLECLDGSDIQTLISVCKKCHYKIEFNRSGGKRNMGHARMSTRKRLINAES